MVIWRWENSVFLTLITPEAHCHFLLFLKNCKYILHSGKWAWTDHASHANVTSIPALFCRTGRCVVCPWGVTKATAATAEGKISSGLSGAIRLMLALHKTGCWHVCLSEMCARTSQFLKKLNPCLAESCTLKAPN